MTFQPFFLMTVTENISFRSSPSALARPPVIPRLLNDLHATRMEPAEHIRRAAQTLEGWIGEVGSVDHSGCSTMYWWIRAATSIGPGLVT